MCGICGVFDMSGGAHVSGEPIKAMADTMVHRGPDDEGTYVSPDMRVGLGFRRLSIVDLLTGHQPMSNAACDRRGRSVHDLENGHEGTVWTVFNGEIYNHEELRRELEASGHTYSTRSDTESVIHGYEEWGQDVVLHLRGMFAFAIYDGRADGGREFSGRPKLFLARDRLGIKPLYYTEQAGRFLFASEVKAILAWPGVPREVDGEALHHYLTLSVAPAPLTMFEGIRKLAPGHTLTVYRDGAGESRQYWDPLSSKIDLDDQSEAELVERLREMLRESVNLRMMSDVPFGVFLSGGMDSSLNVALMSELMDRPVDTFSVAIQDDAASDERSSARRVARHFGANHQEVVITHQDFIDFLPQMAYHQDEPLADPVCVPLYFVSKLARENGTSVIQVGEGADELFAGYVDYARLTDFHRRLYRPFAALPAWAKRPVASLAPHLLSASRAEYVRRAAAGQELFWGGVTVFTEEAKRDLLLTGHDGPPYDTYAGVVAPYYESYDSVRPGKPFLDRITYLELKHRLPELLLMRVDKMTMATSVEARVPYLDHELVEFAMAVPSSLKYRRGRTKHILKEAARGIVPDDIIDRPKTGFCGGASNIVSGPIVDYAEQAITTSEWMREVIDIEVVRALLAEHRSRLRNQGMAIWNLLNLAEWHRSWIN